MPEQDWNGFPDDTVLADTDVILVARAGGGVNLPGTIFAKCDTSGNIIGKNVFVQVGISGTGTGGNLRLIHDGGTLQWVAGILGGAGARAFQIYNNITARSSIDFLANGDIVAGRSVVPGGFGNETEGSFGWVAGAGSYFAINNAGSNGALYISRRSAASTLLVSFATQGTQTGTITTNGTTTSYNTTSDYRLKDKIVDLTDSGAFIDALRPRRGVWKEDGSDFVGFIAHEFAEVSPSSVNGEKDETEIRSTVDEKTGKTKKTSVPKMQSMQASSPEVMAHIILELQTLRARLAEAEAKLEAL